MVSHVLTAAVADDSPWYLVSHVLTAAVADDSPCSIQREEALQNNNTLYIPACTKTGAFEPLQCIHRGEKDVCVCVDPISGTPFKSSIAADDDESCTGRRNTVHC